MIFNRGTSFSSQLSVGKLCLDAIVQCCQHVLSRKAPEGFVKGKGFVDLYHPIRQFLELSMIFDSLNHSTRLQGFKVPKSSDHMLRHVSHRFIVAGNGFPSFGSCSSSGHTLQRPPGV